MSVQVHWHEGLFLQPHHLQHLQRQSLDRLGAERGNAYAYPYGVVSARISSDELENMRVRFDQLRVILPGGMVVDVPENADLPSLDISEQFAASTRPLTVSLGVPLWYSNRGNALEIGDTDWRVKRLYRVAEQEAPDENTGENRQSLLVRKINARLLLDTDDRSDLEVLPLLRIGHGAGDDVGLPRLDASFVPSCFLLSGSPTLRDTLRDLANQVEAARKEAVIVLTRAGFNVELLTGVRVQQLMRLQVLNRYAATLMPMVQAAGGFTPFDIYLEMRRLLADLAALQPDRDAWDAPKYDHDNPGPVFMELS
ncbi:MAG: type VI secretion system baseplate subunit TssK, partial [Planctomycetota bacterium]